MTLLHSSRTRGFSLILHVSCPSSSIIHISNIKKTTAVTSYFKFTIWPLIMLIPTGLDILSRTSHTYGSNPGYHLLFGCHVSLSSSRCESFSYFLCFTWPQLLGEVLVRYSIECLFNCSMSDVSSWLDDGFWEGRPEFMCILIWPPNAKSSFIGKDPDTGKDWKQKEKGATENEMVRKHHWLNGHEFE